MRRFSLSLALAAVAALAGSSLAQQVQGPMPPATFDIDRMWPTSTWNPSMMMGPLGFVLSLAAAAALIAWLLILLRHRTHRHN